MEQVVGQKCIHCQKTIESIVEGWFCRACGQPVHRECTRPDLPITPDCCESCGAAIDSEEAVRQRLEQLNQIESQRESQNAFRSQHFYTDFKQRSEGRWELISGLLLVVAGTAAACLIGPLGLLAVLGGVIMIGRSYTKF